MSLTRRLVRLVRDKRVTEPDLEAAALFVLDAIACAVAGTVSPQGRILRQRSRAGGDSAAQRAFTLGGLAHILEIDDLHRESVTHPGCVVVPAAWSVAAERNLDGQAMLRAVLHGYEAGTRVGIAVGQEHYRVWHNTSTCGPFASAMAVATLLELSEEAAVWALGNAGTQSCGLWQFLEEGAMSKHLHTARAAEAGLTGAELAALGFTGAERILEGEKGLFRAACPDAQPQRMFQGWGGPWQLHCSSIKLWPSCRHTHAPIDVALRLREELHRGNGCALSMGKGAVPVAPLASDDVIAICVETYEAALDLCNRPDPDSLYEAKFSLQHCVAAGLGEGIVDLTSFDSAARSRLAGLRGLVQVSTADDFEDAYPECWGARITVHRQGTAPVSKELPCAKGDPEAAVSPDEIRAKAVMLMAHGGVEPETAEDLVCRVLALPGGGALPPLPI